MNFPFAGTTYTNIFIGSNGLISFGNQGGVPFNNLDPRPFPIENSTFIAPLWMDYGKFYSFLQFSAIFNADLA